jgi:polyisoprenoid-binding protein YceI
LDQVPIRWRTVTHDRCVGGEFGAALVMVVACPVGSNVGATVFAPGHYQSRKYWIEPPGGRSMKALGILLSILVSDGVAAKGIACTDITQFDLGHSSVVFSVPIEDALSDVVGSFQLSKVSLRWCPDAIGESRLDVEVRPESVSTGIVDRDRELRSDAFLATQQFPVARFSSRHLRVVGGEMYRLDGDLAIRGISRPLALDVRLRRQLSDDGVVIALKTEFTIDRDDFGVTWRHPVESFVGDAVQIKVSLLSRLLRPETFREVR